MFVSSPALYQRKLSGQHAQLLNQALGCTEEDENYRQRAMLAKKIKHITQRKLSGASGASHTNLKSALRAI